MPFINGRYHLNPITGAALEAAREAEAAMLALQDHAQRTHAGDAEAADSADSATTNTGAPANAPIHHLEIEATELVPAHSQRATRGFVARIHRSASQPPAPAGPGAPCAYNHPSPSVAAVKLETHVFSDHRDLLNFLHHELSKR